MRCNIFGDSEPLLGPVCLFTLTTSPNLTLFDFGHLLQCTNDFGLIGFSGPIGFEQEFSKIQCFCWTTIFFSNQRAPTTHVKKTI